MRFNYEDNYWTFCGDRFDGAEDYAGFVYEITVKSTGKKYIGKKFLWSYRKDSKDAKRRTKRESDWRYYVSSSEEIKKIVKESGIESISREIISLHKLIRDVNYSEVKEQFVRGVLEKVDDSGELVYVNGNINGKWNAKHVKGIDNRSQYARG